MFLSRLTHAVLFALVALALAGPAEAQQTYYLWRDANGNLGMGDQLPRGMQAFKTFAVPGTDRRILATAPPAGDYAGQYDALIERYATANGVRADLVRAVIQVESGFNPRARSPKGARGLMQLMPGTALELGVANSYDPEENIRGGVQYLKSLLDRYGKDETLALAAYNAGPMAVDSYGYVVPPYRETQAYVQRVQVISPQLPAAAKSQAPKAPGSAPAAPLPLQGSRTLYKTVIINADGQPVSRYTDTKPSSGDYEVVNLRR